MNATLGFDFYLVMWNGARARAGEDAPRHGCYYCNNGVVPADVSQRCNIPQGAFTTSPLLLHKFSVFWTHAFSVRAPAPPPAYDYKSQDDVDDEVKDKTKDFRSIFGCVPHQLRGFLAQSRTLPDVGAAYDQYTGCSEIVSTRILISLK